MITIQTVSAVSITIQHVIMEIEITPIRYVQFFHIVSVSPRHAVRSAYDAYIFRPCWQFSLMESLDARYHGINLHAFFTKGTIEFRLFNSTLDADKVRYQSNAKAE